MRTSLLWFFAGCILIGVVALVLSPNLQRDKQGAIRSAQLVGQLQGQVRAAQVELEAATQAKETCEAKFHRATILYDGVLFQDRRWIIPADIEPTYLGKVGQADYTHVDPKTQMETMHMKPKQQ